jgi:hypothetical protein
VNDNVQPPTGHIGRWRELRDQFDLLYGELVVWEERDESPEAPPQPEAVRAGTDALHAVDRLLAYLHGMRERLTDEQRRFSEAQDAAWRHQHPWFNGGSGPGWTER